MLELRIRCKKLMVFATHTYTVGQEIGSACNTKDVGEWEKGNTVNPSASCSAGLSVFVSFVDAPTDTR